MARESRTLARPWLQACDAFLSAVLAHTRHLRAAGRLADPESAKDIAALEEEHARLRRRLERPPGEPPPDSAVLRLPDDPADRLTLAARRELRRRREAVRDGPAQLPARGAALLRRARAARRLRVVDGTAASPDPGAG